MLEQRKQFTLLLLAIFAFQCSEGLFKKLISIEHDPRLVESAEHYNFKFPTIKLLKPFSTLENKKVDKLEKKEEGLDTLVGKKLETEKEQFDEKLLELFDLFKEKKQKEEEHKPPLAPNISAPIPSHPLPPRYYPEPDSSEEHSYPYRPVKPKPPSPPKYKSRRPHFPMRASHPLQSPRYYEESDPRVEQSYPNRPIRPIRPRPAVHCPYYDYDVRYFT